MTDPREGLSPDHVHEVVVIGSGFGGQAATVMLGRQGIDDVVILERRDFAGGTWCQNTYPGAAVDVQSHLYSLSFEPYPWSQVFAEQHELRDYTEHILDSYGIRERILLGRDVSSVRWDDDAEHWVLATTGGEEFRARFVINATGPLSTPVVPPFRGKETFAGPAFHTNDWDHSVDLAGKRAAVVGSGASATQVIPAIAEEVGELHVFQRSPHWVMPRGDRVFTRLENRLINSRVGFKLMRTFMYWKLEARILGFRYSTWGLDTVAGGIARRHLRKQVPDPELRRRLTPDYVIGCKRILLSNTLFPAMSRENVTLHDREDGIAEVTPDGITTTTGDHVGLDVIIWATGYDATDGLISYPIRGRDGLALSEVWADYPRAHLGTMIPGFPNFFLVAGPNTGIGHTSAIFIIEAQMRYIASAIEKARKRDSTVEVRAEAEDRYTNGLHEEMEKTVWQKGGCTSWYRSASGKVVAMYPGFSFVFRHHTAAARDADHVYA